MTDTNNAVNNATTAPEDKNQKKSYYVQLPGYAKGEVWDEDKYNRNKEALFREHPDVSVFERTTGDIGNDIADDEAFTVYRPGFDKGELWDGAKLKRNREKLYKDIPDIQVSRVKAVDYNAETLAETNSAIAERMKRMDEISHFDAEHAQAVATPTGGVQTVLPSETREEKKRIEGELTELYAKREANPAYQREQKAKAQFFDDENARYTAAMKELEESNPTAARAHKAKWMQATSQGRFIAYSKEGEYDPEYTRDIEALAAARNFMDEAKKTAFAPSKYDSTNGFANFFRGIYGVGADVLTAKQLMDAGLNMRLIDAVKKIQETEGTDKSLFDLISDPGKLSYLSDAERELVRAFCIKAEVDASRAGDLSLGYQSGDSAFRSLGFMADFLATGGIGTAAGKAATKGLLKATAKMSAELGLKGATRTAALAVPKFAIGTLEAAVKTAVMSPLMPSTWVNIQDNLLQLNDAETLNLGGDAIWRAVGDSFIENLSENAGPQVEAMLGGAVKLAGKGANRLFHTTKFTDWAKIFDNSGATRLLRDAAWNGYIGEIGEEWYGNALRVMTGVDPDALKNFATVDQQIITLTSFAPMSVFGGATSAAQYGLARKNVSKSGDYLANVLRKNGYGEEQIKDILDVTKAENPTTLASHLAPVISQIANDDLTAGQEAYKAVMDYADAIAKYRVFDGIHDSDVSAQRDKMHQELRSQMGDDADIVLRRSSKTDDGADAAYDTVHAIEIDGKTAYIIGENGEDRTVALQFEDGEKRIYSKSVVDDMLQSEEADWWDKGETRLDDYLDMRIAARKGAAEQNRMNSERSEQAAAIIASVNPGDQINVGTEEAPIMGTVVGKNGEKVILEVEGQYRELTPDEVGNALKKPISVKSDEDIERELVEREERRKRPVEFFRGKTDMRLQVVDESGDVLQITDAITNYAQPDSDSVQVKVDLGDDVYEWRIIPSKAVNAAIDEYERQQAAATGTADIPAETTSEGTEAIGAETKPAEPSVPTDFRGNPIPLKKDGTVDQTAFWNNDPEAWTKWNDEKRGDGGVNSMEYLKKASDKLKSDIKATQKALDRETDFDKIDQLEQQRASLEGRLKTLSDIQNGYRMQAAEAARQKAEEDAAKAKAARDAQAAELEKYNTDSLESIKEKWEKAPKEVGSEDTFVLSSGEEIGGHYVLTEAFAPTASHNTENGFAKTEGFPVDENGRTVNDRDYEHDKAAQQQVEEKAASYDQRALQTPVVVSQDGVVLSGNDRTMASQIAARQGTDTKYNEYLAKHAQKYGFTPEQVAGFKNPRVVFVPNSKMPYDAATFAKFNAEDKKTQSKTESAVKAGKVVPKETVERIAQIIDGHESIAETYADEKAVAAIIRELVDAGIIQKNEISKLMDGSLLSGTGEDLVESVILGAVLREDALRCVMEDKAMRRSIMSALTQLIKNNSYGEYSLMDEFSAAVVLLYQAKKSGLVKIDDKVANYLDQPVLEGFGENPVASATIQMLADIINSRKVNELKNVISLYNARAAMASTGQADLFLGDIESREQILTEIIAEYERRNNTGQQEAVSGGNEETGSTEEQAPDAVRGETGSGEAEEGVKLEKNEVDAFISQMERGAETAQEIELTPENWIAQFGTDGLVNTPIGNVKMGENQYFKLAQEGRNGKLGMVKPTLERPDIIIEDYGTKDGEKYDRAYSYVFIKAFVGKDGKRIYYFTSVTVSIDSLEVVISNQEKSKNRISKLLLNGNVAWINTRFSLHPTAQIEESVPRNDSNEPTDSDNQPAFLGINSSENGDSKDTQTSGKTSESAEKSQTETKNEGQFGLVSDDRMAELKKRLLEKIKGQLNSGFDPELLSIGMEMAAGYIDRGIKTFVDFSKAMIADFGDAIRPYLKAFYNGAREMPGMEQLSKEMDAYDSVSAVDVNSVGKEETPGEVQSEEGAAESEKPQTEAAATLGTVTKDKDTRDGSDLWVVKPKERVSNDEFKELKTKAKDNNGYWSSFKKGFLFRDEQDANKFNSIDNGREEQPAESGRDAGSVQIDDKRRTDTAAAVLEAGTVAGEVESLAQDEGRPDERRASEAIAKVDKTVEKVNGELALLGYYEAEKNEKDYNEAYGYMRNAEKKAVKDAQRLAEKLAFDLGLEIKDKAKANIAPAGGDITFRLQLADGSDLYVDISISPNKLGFFDRDGDYDDLGVRGIMYRVDKGSDYGQNCFLPEKVTYQEMLKDIRSRVSDKLPQQPTTGDLLKNAEIVAEKSRKQKKTSGKKDKSEEKSAYLQDGNGLMGNLFADLDDTENVQTDSEETAPQAQPVEVELAKQEDNGLQGVYGVRAEGMRPDDSGHESGPSEEHGESGEGIGQDGGRTDGQGTGSGVGENRDSGSRLGHPIEEATEFNSVESSATEAAEVSTPAPATEKAEKKAKKNTHNNSVARGVEYAPKTPAERFRANIEAIKLMKKLIEEERQASKSDMEILRKYTGWGGLGTFFNNGYSKEYRELTSILTAEELQSAEYSINTAYFTPSGIIDTLWDIAKRLGFEGGKILEGSAGIGNMLASMPKSMSEKSDISAVELDTLTGNMLKLLYPDADVQIKGFQDADIENNSVDLAITNVPFGTDISVYDSKEKDLTRKFGNRIHDFCIAKNIRKLREGGIGIFITTSGTLDKSRALRNWVVTEGNADFIGAFRLNNETFGGTPVTSDIIVVRKRVGGKKSPNAIDVNETTRTRSVEIKEKEEWNSKKREWETPTREVPMEYNSYFVQHPENMAGEMRFGQEAGDTFRPASTGLYPDAKKPQDKLLSKWAKQLQNSTKDEVSSREQQSEAAETESTDNVKEGQIIVNSKGEICLSQRGKAVPIETNSNKVKGYAKQQVIKDYDALKNATGKVLDYQTKNGDDKGLKPLLEELNRAYDEFTSKYGNLNKNAALSFLRNDVDFPSIAAVEDYKEEVDSDGKKVVKVSKTDIFNKRVVGVNEEPHPKNVKDGVIVSINREGEINVPYIAKETGLSEEQVQEEVLASGLGFVDPATGKLEVRYNYLSGNVREKLEYAREHNTDGKYDGNIKALEKVIPADIPAHLINFTLGSDWIDGKFYTDYAKEKFGLNDNFTPVNIGGVWSISDLKFIGDNNEKNRAAGVMSEKTGNMTLGHELMLAAMNNTPVKFSKTVKHHDGTTETITDQEATNAAQAKIEDMRQEFCDWAKDKIMKDNELAKSTSDTYNRMFNAIAPKEIEDEFLPVRFPGATTQRTLYPHQKKAVIRGTTEPVLLAHEVGTGKSYTLISTAMELRRLGLAKKPMIVVQNATVGQFVGDAKLLYPNSKILTVSDADRTSAGRTAFYAKIKYNDWDMIVVPQSVFEMIPDSEERQRAFIQEKIDEKMHVIELAKQAGMDSRTISSMKKELADLKSEYETGEAPGKRKKRDAKKEAKTKENAAAKAKQQLDRKTDNVENFDEMGIDALLIDEAHAYKHLGFSTQMQRGVKGVDPSYSKRSAGVYLKLQSIFDRVGRRNVVFATGTPISNTAAEIWTFMKYLVSPDVMRANHIYYFDDFVRNFGRIAQSTEFTTSGKYKETTRFSGYINLPELVRTWSSVADTVLSKDAKDAHGEDFKEKLPEIEGGKAQDIFLPQSPSLIGLMNFVREKLDKFDKMSGKEKREHSSIPLVMYGIAQRAAIDPRLVDSNAADEPLSKTNKAVEEILKDLKQTESYRGTCAVFCDNYRRLDATESGDKVEGFNLFKEMKRKLIEGGVPEEQIVIMESGMSVNKKQQIFDRVIDGDVRVIMGTTQTLGTGVNIQTRLHAVVHMDAPNRPMDYTQRNGRILRQGNLHKEWDKTVRIIRFGVEDSLDVTAYQRLKTKSEFIDAIMNGKPLLKNAMEGRTIEEPDEGLFDNAVAQLSGSQYALKVSAAEREIRKLNAQKQQHEQDQIYIEKQLRENESKISRFRDYIEDHKKTLATITDKFKGGKVAKVTIEGRTYSSEESLNEGLKEKVTKPIREYLEEGRKDYLFSEGKLSFNLSFDGVATTVNVIVRKTRDYIDGKGYVTKMSTEMTYDCPVLGVEDRKVAGNAIKEMVSDFRNEIATGKNATRSIEALQNSVERMEQDDALMQERRGKPFKDEEKLKEARAKLTEYQSLMKKEMEEKEAKYAQAQSSNADSKELNAEIDDLMDDEGNSEDVEFEFEDDEDYTPLESAPEKQLAFDAVSEMLNNAGVRTEILSDEEMEQLAESSMNDASLSQSRSPRARWLDSYVEAESRFLGKSKKEARAEILRKMADAKKEAKELYEDVLSGNFNAVTLQRINDYIDSATPRNIFYRPLSQRLPERALLSLPKGERTGSVDALFSRICESTVPANGRTRADGRREIEARKEELLEKWAKATGNWHESIADFTGNTEAFGSGTDSEVFLSDDGTKVIKASKGKFDNRKHPSDIDQVALFNSVFPGSAYRILGYGRLNGNFVRFLEQPFVDFSTSKPLTTEERVTFMNGLGFAPLNEEKTLFTNDELVVSDLQKSNIVKDAAGNIRVIDADVKLHTKDLGGNYTYPPVETDTDTAEFDSEVNDKIEFLQNGSTVYGAAVGSKILLNTERLNPNTPIHEYTHLWDAACRQKNPELWKRGVELMKQTPLWDEIKNDPNYTGLDEDGIAGEVHARLAGKNGAETLERMSREALEKNGGFIDKAAKLNVIQKLRNWLSEFWYWVKNTMTPWSKDEADKVSIEDFVNMPLADLAKGTRLNESQQNAEERDIVERAKADGTYMKAPNGKASNLNERQWVQVRTKAFKKWFGDWEKDPKNASKVVDENGEPRVVYHGTDSEFTVFDPEKGDYLPSWEPASKWTDKHRCFYFTGLRKMAESYKGASQLKEVFLNIRDAFKFDGKGRTWNDLRPFDYKPYEGEDIVKLAKATYDNLLGQSKADAARQKLIGEKGGETDAQSHFKKSILVQLYKEYKDIENSKPKNALDKVIRSLRLAIAVRNMEKHKNSYKEFAKAANFPFRESAMTFRTRDLDLIFSDKDGIIMKSIYDYGDKAENPEPGDVFVVYDSNNIKSATYNSGEFSIEDNDIRFHIITNKKEIDRLNSEPTMKVYRGMQLVDGKLYPPMSAKVNGEWREGIDVKDLGKVWEQADENPELADDKGNFKLDKGNKSSLKARYNPYIHTSTTPLNDQFSSAQSRPELVTVEVEIPKSELTSGYKAEKAKDSVGKVEWKAGVIQSQLTGTRTVILSRWDKPIRIVPDSEVADVIVKMFGDKKITMPSNVVTPSLRAELEKRGIPFVETDNTGKPVTRFRDGSDSAYSKAVAEGDMETAQKIVDAEAEKKMEKSVVRNEDGTLKKVYHGSRASGFTVFDKTKTDDGRSLFFTDNKDIAKGYAETEGEEGSEYSVYLDMRKPLVIDADGARWNGLNIAGVRWILKGTENPTLKKILDRINRQGATFDYINEESDVRYKFDYDSGRRTLYELFSDEEMEKIEDELDPMDIFDYLAPKLDGKGKSDIYTNTRTVSELAEDAGYDGVIFNNIIDGASEETTETVSNVYAVFDPSAVKSADAVTRDNEGNVIPPSERFNREDEDIRYREEGIEAINDRFDADLKMQAEGTLPEGHIYQLGRPSDVLLSAGIPNLPIELSATRLAEKSGQRNHMFDILDVAGLPKALWKPLAVFSYGDKAKAQNVIVSLKKDGKQFVVGIHFNQERRGLLVNDIRGLFNKNNAEWLNWISQGKSLYLNKTEIQALIDQQRTNLAEVEYLDLDSVTKILNDFENPKVGANNESEEMMRDEEARPTSFPTEHSRSTAGKKLAAEETAKTIGVGFEYISRDELPESHKGAKGMWRDGKIYVCAENNADADDIKRTMLHEAVGHMGLRKLVGDKNMGDFCMQVYKMLPKSERAKIANAAAQKYGLNFEDATEEYLAEMAETFDLSEDYDTIWDRIRVVLHNAFAKIGINLPLSERDARWILWQSYNANRQGDLINQAKRQVLADRLGFSFRADNMRQHAAEGIRFRDMNNNAVTSAANLYNTFVSRASARLHEGYVDMFNSVNTLVDAIEKQTGRAAAAFEDIRLALNQQSSKALAAIEHWERTYYTPLMETIKDIIKKSGLSSDEVDRYAFLKHGLERNVVLAKRDAKQYYEEKMRRKIRAIRMSSDAQATKDTKIQKAKDEYDRHCQDVDAETDSKYLKLRDNDYSGLTSLYSTFAPVSPRGKDESNEEYQARVLASRTPMYDNLKDVEDAARKEVANLEGKIGSAGVAELWKRTNAATKATLRHQYDSGMLTKEQYEHVRDMFQYYVPMRGFADNTAEDMYTYYASSRGGFTPPLQTAKGRKSQAASPWGYIGAMASSAVAADSKNEAKLTLYYFASNRPENDLVTISDVWYEKTGIDPATGKTVFTPVYPTFSDSLDKASAKAALDKWEQDMQTKAAKGDAFKGARKLDLKNSVIHIDKENSNSHVIRVKVNGQDKMMFINGNPRAAQAINNELNLDAVSGPITNGAQAFLRHMAAFNTSYNPEFWISNLQRDLLFSLMAVDVKEGAGYRHDFLRNLRRSVKVFKMLRANKNGKLGTGRIENAYREFVDNGGVTGFTVVKDNEEWEQTKREFLADKNKAVQGVANALGAIQDLGESIEQMTRFAAYLTSREHGKDIREAISDAKELTVNFNRKGSGKPISIAEARQLTDKDGKQLSKAQQCFYVLASSMPRVGRLCVMFFNAGVQGLNTMYQLWKKDHRKTAVWMAGYFALGVINAVLHSLFDDDDDYLDMPEYERRNNALLGGNGYYFKWALPQESRVFYAMGDVLVNDMILGRNPQKKTRGFGDIVESVFDVMPVNPMNGWRGVMPEIARPIAEIAMNEDYKGEDVHRDSRWLSDEEKELTPKYKQAYDSTPKPYVYLSMAANWASGGDSLDSGFLNLYPEDIQHLVEGYSGGLGTFVNRLYGATVGAIDSGARSAAKGEGFAKGVMETTSVRTTPFLNRLLIMNDERRRNAHTSEVFNYYKAQAEHTKRLIQEAKKSGDDKAIDKIFNDDERLNVYTFYEAYKKLDEAYFKLMRLTDDDTERRQLMREQDEIRKEMIEEIAKENKK